MIQIITYIGLGIITGFSAAWFIHLFRVNKLNKSVHSLEGFLETEKLVRDRIQKENTWLIETKESSHKQLSLKIIELNNVIKLMDEDILLLQKSNEETEALLATGNPVVHNLKLKLIEANNTIARFKAQIPVK